jgi:UDP-glucose 4-epimerase
LTQRTILVTGGAGHVGSHVVELLAADPGNRVISLDNYFLGQVENHVAGAEYRRGHTKEIGRLVPETPDLVFHLGEYSRIAPSFDDVELVYDMNVTGTFAVVDFCRVRGVRKLIYAGSSTKFAIEGDGRHQSPYAFTKATNVDLITDFGRWYGLPYTICYFYNGFGPRERGDGKYGTVIARFEAQWRRREALTVIRPGTQRRAFTYVKDLARGIVMAGEKGRRPEYALGATASYSVLEIAEAFGGPVRLIDGRPGRRESENDAAAAREDLGWNTTVDVIEYIKEFVRNTARDGAS